jgi:hypothetical protein
MNITLIISSILSVLSAIIIAIPLLNFQDIRNALNIKSKSIDEIGRTGFSDGAKASEVLKVFEKQRKYTSIGLVVLAISVALSIFSQL